MDDMKKFAVFGDSYVTRQGRFGVAFPFPDPVKFIGEDDMRALSIPDDKWQELKTYKPYVCILHLGGNDIQEDTNVKELFVEIMARVTELRDSGIYPVVAEILPRAEFGLKGVSLRTFELIRKSLNKRIRRALAHDFSFLPLHVRLCNYYYDPYGGVNLSYQGMWKYYETLVKEFSNYL